MGLFSKITNWKSAINQAAHERQMGIKLDDGEIKKLQNCILGLFLDIFQVCEQNGIDLFLTGGAAIGALRHQGFIPWDDDIDCGIRRKDYSRFVEVIKKEFGDKYIINAPNVCKNPAYRFTKILIPGTVYREVGIKENRTFQMIGIDIFIIENVPDNRFRRLIKGLRCNFLEFISGQVSLRENRNKETDQIYNGSLRLPYRIKLIIGWIFSFRSASRWFEILDRAARYHIEHTKYCSIVTGRKHYFGEIAPREVFFPSNNATFCGNEIKVFHDEDQYLRLMYGDYMKIPPVEKREKHFLAELDYGKLDRREEK